MDVFNYLQISLLYFDLFKHIVRFLESDLAISSSKIYPQTLEITLVWAP